MGAGGRRVIIGALLGTAVVGGTLLLYRWNRGTPAEPALPPPPSATEALSRKRPDWRIAVIGSGFVNQEDYQIAFDAFEEAIHKDRHFEPHARRIHFVPVPFEAARLTVSRSDRCFFARDQAFGRKVGALVQSNDLPGLTSVLVLHSDAQTTGSRIEACAAGELVIAGRNSESAIPHEFGHLIGGLFDEDTGSERRPSKVQGPNCVSTTEQPPWDTASLGTPIKGCWHNGDLLRPVNGCRMQVNGNDFCTACLKRLDEVFADIPPPFSEPPPSEYTQFLLQVWLGKPPEFEIVSQRVYPGAPPAQVMRGATVVGSKPDDATVCLGGSTSFGLSTHVYGASETNSPSSMSAKDDDAIFVVLSCGGNVRRDKLTSLEFVPVPPSRDLWVRPATFLNNRGREGAIAFSVR